MEIKYLNVRTVRVFDPILLLLTSLYQVKKGCSPDIYQNSLVNLRNQEKIIYILQDIDKEKGGRDNRLTEQL